MYVEKYLDISTAHVSEQDMKTMALDPDTVSVYYYKRRSWEGAFIHVSWDSIDNDPEYRQRLLDAGFSEEFVNIIWAARNLGCTFIRIDSDGPIYDEFPEFDWE